MSCWIIMLTLHGFAWPHKFPGLRTQEIDHKKNQQGWSSPSFEISGPEKIPLCFLNLMHELETLWPSFLPPAALTEALVQSATNTGCPPPSGAHHVQSRSSPCSCGALRGNSSSFNRSWCMSHSPGWCGVFSFLCHHSGRAALPTRKALPCLQHGIQVSRKA